jgi:hypothetical protein
MNSSSIAKRMTMRRKVVINFFIPLVGLLAVSTAYRTWTFHTITSLSPNRSFDSLLYKSTPLLHH